MLLTIQLMCVYLHHRNKQTKLRKMKTLNTTNGTFENPTKYLVINNSNFIMSTVNERETEKAILVNVLNTNCGSNKSYWMPKSVIVSKSENDVILAAWYVKNTFGYIA